MLVRRMITEAAVDAATDYFKEQFAKLKEFDLDKDGQKDVDQILDIVERIGLKAKDALVTTNFANIAAGLEQIMAGASLIGKSMDKDKLSALGQELQTGSQKLGELAQLSIKYVKEQGDNRPT